MKSESVSPDTFGLAIVLIRTSSAERLAAWWAGTLGLPIIRGREPTYYLSLGDCVVLELLADRGEPRGAGNAPPGIHLDIASRDIEATRSRLEKLGCRCRPSTNEEGRTRLHVQDPDGNRIEVHGSSAPRASFWPGCAPLAEDLVGLTRLVRNCLNVNSLSGFYGRFLKQRSHENSDRETRTFEFGNNVELTLKPGGVARAAVRQRGEARRTFVIRVADHDKAAAGLVESNVPVVQRDIRLSSAVLSYFADPEGQTWAVDERYPPEQFQRPRREFAEDKEIRRRLSQAKTGLSR